MNGILAGFVKTKLYDDPNAVVPHAGQLDHRSQKRRQCPSSQYPTSNRLPGAAWRINRYRVERSWDRKVKATDAPGAPAGDDRLLKLLVLSLVTREVTRRASENKRLSLF